MAYHQRADRGSLPDDRAKRVGHLLWLIRHHPESELLHSPVAHFSADQITPADYQRAVSLWEAATKSKAADAAVQWNAASFFEQLDPRRHLDYLEATAAIDPNHPFALRPLAYLYALSILRSGPLAARAQAGLEASKNVWVLGNAAYMFQSQYNAAGQPAASELAERYFRRAQQLDPKLDRRAILPSQAKGHAGPPEAYPQPDLRSRLEEGARKIRRIPVDAFSELPPALVTVLQARNCRVPQPLADGPLRNVVRGDFFAKGESSWAVLCSVNGATSLLVFRNSVDKTPDHVTTSEDHNYVQNLGTGKVGYSRKITAASREVMTRYYRAHGGPQLPIVDHDGVEDAFLEKASSVWYFYGGKWLRLPGAD